jgi:transposase
MVRLIGRVLDVEVETADMLVNEVLARHLRDRKTVARYAGLTLARRSRRSERGLRVPATLTCGELGPAP